MPPILRPTRNGLQSFTLGLPWKCYPGWHLIIPKGLNHSDPGCPPRATRGLRPQRNPNAVGVESNPIPSGPAMYLSATANPTRRYHSRRPNLQVPRKRCSSSWRGGPNPQPSALSPQPSALSPQPSAPSHFPRSQTGQSAGWAEPPMLTSSGKGSKSSTCDELKMDSIRSKIRTARRIIKARQYESDAYPDDD